MIFMKKMCIFVEGQTEQIFLEKLLIEIAGRKNVALSIRQIKGGGQNSKVEKVILTLKDDEITEQTRYYVQIISCNNDEKVNTELRNNCLSMQLAGFSKVLGLRDLYPKKLSELSKVKKYSIIKMDGLHIPTKSIVATSEVETWFLGEYTALEKIDSRLTYDHIKQSGYDLKIDLLDSDEKYHHSANILDIIMKTVQRRYDKKRNKVEKIVNNFDYEAIYLELRNRFLSLNELLDEFDDFFN